MRYRQAPCSCLLRRAEARAVLTRRARPIARHVSHVREVGRSVAALRRADGDEEDVRALYDLGQPLGASKLEPSCALGDELLEAGLVERDPSLSEACHALLVVVQACHPVFYIGKRRPGRQPDVARPNDTHIKVLHATCFPYTPSEVILQFITEILQEGGIRDWPRRQGPTLWAWCVLPRPLRLVYEVRSLLPHQPACS